MRYNKLLIFSIAILAASSLMGCAKKETIDTISNELSENLSKIASMNYSTDIDLELTSELYGEQMKMMYKGNISTDRIIKTSELHSFSDYSTQAFDDKYNEQIENYIVADNQGYKEYATFDGKQFYVLDLERDANADSKGPLGLIPFVTDKDNTTDLSWDYINGKKDNGYIINSIMSGSYLSYTLDEINMSGLIDFKQSINEKVTADVKLTLDKEKLPKSIKMTFKDTGNLFPSILGGMDKDNIKSEMEHFSINITFNTLNEVSGIKIPEKAANAVKTDDLGNFSVQVTQNEKVKSETFNKIRTGNLSFELPSNWTEASSGAISNSVSSGGKQTVSKNFKHAYSTSTIQINGGKALIGTDGTNEFGINLDETDRDETMKVYLSNKLEKVKNNYSNMTSITGNIPYIIGSTGRESSNHYEIYLTDGKDEYNIIASFDNSNLYTDYYDETLTHLINSFKFLIDTEEDENYIKVEETKPERPKITADINQTSTKGTKENPYMIGETLSIKIIDMSTGNIANENITVKGILEDKIIVKQKIKEHENKTNAKLSDGDNIKLIQFSVSTSNYSYIDNAKLDFVLETTIIEGVDESESLNGTTPLGVDSLVLSQNDKEEQFIMAYNIKNIEDSVLKVKYIDPDLGNTELYVKLK